MEQQVEKQSQGLNLVASLLPELEKGLTRIQYNGDRPVFQLLVGSEISNGECVWIDTDNSSSTYALADIAGEKALEKVSIGRAFTPFQHHQLCMELEEFIDEDTEIIALPSINGLYEQGQVNSSEAEELLEEALKNIREVAEKQDLKVIISNSSKAEGKLEYLTGVYSQDFVNIQETDQGLKFSSEDFQTLIYPKDGILQTTLPLWLQRKHGGDQDRKNKRHLQATP
jgi:hypothetical protein